MSLFNHTSGRVRPAYRVLSLILVCVMVWGLMPSDAIAMEPICGLEEHVHDQTCHAVYGEDVLKCDYARYIHEHDGSCHGPGGELTCLKADFVLHRHDDFCYAADGSLACELPERDESIHEAAYDGSDNITCVYAPYFDHVHGPDCYRTEKVLTCEIVSDDSAHVHDDGCYTQELTCGIEVMDVPENVESPEDDATGGTETGVETTETPVWPSEGPFGPVQPEQGGNPSETPDASQGAPEGGSEASGDADAVDVELPLLHEHTAGCYARVLTCGLEAGGHVHDDGCYDIQSVLDCDYDSNRAEDLNIPVGGTVCHHYTYDLHAHDAGCYGFDGSVTCGQWEVKSHEHGSICFEKEILSYDSPEVTCRRDEHKHGITCYFRDKTEELDAFLEAYDAFMTQANDEALDMDDPETAQAMAGAAWQVRQLSEALDKDVLKLESIQEMLSNLDRYIPEGFVPGDGVTGPDVLDGALFAVEPKIELDIVAPLDEQSLRCDISVELVDSHGAAEPDFSLWPFVIRDGDASQAPAVKFFEAGEYDLRFTMTGSSDNVILDTRSWDVKIIATMAADGKTVETPVVTCKQAVDGSESADSMRFMLRPSGSTMKKYSSKIKSQAQEIMAGMTTEQLAGQMLLPHFSGNAGGYGIDYAQMISQYHVGGLILFDADIQDRNPTTLRALLNDAQAKGKAANNNVGMLISVDEEGGRRSNNTLINRVSNWPQYGHDPFVSSKEMYAAGGFQNIYNCEVDKGQFLTDLGFNMNHGPVLDLAKTGYVSGRSFSDNGLETAPYAVSSIRGLHDGGVGISMKHFPGYGNTSANTHNGWAVNDLDENAFQYNELVPFYAGMAAGGDTIMVTHNSITWLDPSNEHCASCNPAVYALAREMGFEGLALTDDLNMGAITNKYGSGAVAAINAGADVALTGNYNDLQAVQDAVADGTIPMSRVRESVERILCWKIEHGLIETDTEHRPNFLEAKVLYSGGGSRSGDLKAMMDEVQVYGGTVQLLRNVSYTSVLDVSADNITFDLNGWVLDFGRTGYFNVSGDGFVIRDSVMERMSDEILTSVHAAFPVSGNGYSIDRSGMTALWCGLDANGDSVRRTLDLSECGRIIGTRVSHSLVYVTKPVTVEFRSGVMTGDGTYGFVCAISPKSVVKLTGGWLFGGECTGSRAPVVGGTVIMSDGGFVGVSDGSGWGLLDLEGTTGSGRGYVEFTGGYVVGTSSGGAVIRRNSADCLRMVLSDVEFSANAGGVEAEDIELSVSGCSFLYNTGLASLAYGQEGIVTVFNPSDALSVSDCYFVRNDNTALVFVGLIDAGHAASVSGCVFDGNVSSGDGGAILFRGDRTSGYTGRHVISDCMFRDNKASGNGGAIATLGGSMNSMPPTMVLELRDCDFENCVSVSGYGGAVYFNDSRLFMSDITSRGCKGVSGDSMRISRENATSTISGLLDFNTPVSRLQHESYFFAGSELNLASNIPVGLSYSITDNDAVIICTAAEGVDLSDKAKCFVPVDSGFKTWYDSSRNCIMYGTLAHETGEGVVGISGIALQYYAYVEIADNIRTDVNSYQLPTIDTSADTGGGSGMRFNGSAYLPQEAQVSPGQYAGVWPTRNVYLANPDGSVLTADSRPRVLTHTTMAPIYRSKLFGGSEVASDVEVLNADAMPGDTLDISTLVGKTLSSMNRFVADDGVYDVTEIWVSKPDVSLTSVSQADFDVYPYTDDLFLTADEDVAGGNPNAILLRSNQAVRFVAEPVTGERGMHTIFYDYDISNGNKIGTYENNGKSYDKYDTAAAGINSIGNYANTGSGKFAFGNANTDVSWSSDRHNGRPMNVANREGNWKEVKSECFKYCAFGIVTGLDSDGNLVWASDVDHPNLFNDGDAIGKTVHANSELVFARKGNVYTLDSVRGYDSSSPSLPAGKSLQEFGQYSGVWANNFWPMDTVSSYGTAGHDPKFGVAQTVVNHSNRWWPTSDDGTNHNSYFGMYFQVSFNLIDDYVAPMSYQFFGDDDMWVFLDGQLICDVGGVHQSAGQYVNLRDYLPADESSNGEHTLTVYYLERGASGSSCWMQMHLPNPLRVSTEVPPDSKLTGDLAITKRVSGIESTDEAFAIKVDLTDDKGKAVSGTFEYSGADGVVQAVKSGDTIFFKQDETVTVKKIPFGTHVRLSEELDGNKYWEMDVEESMTEGIIGLGTTEMSITNKYREFGSLKITKRLIDGDMWPIQSDARFAFLVSMRNADGSIVQDALPYELYRFTGELVKPDVVDSEFDWDTLGAELVGSGTLRHGINLEIPANCYVYIPKVPGTVRFEIQEAEAALAQMGFAQVSAENNICTVDHDDQEMVFTNAPVRDMPKLPSAGGIGTYKYYVAGVALLGLVLIETLGKKKVLG